MRCTRWSSAGRWWSCSARCARPAHRASSCFRSRTWCRDGADVTLLRPDLADLEPYRWQEGWEQHVPAAMPVVRLDQNTQPRPPLWYAGAAAWLSRLPVNAYPDSRYDELREAIAAYTGFPVANIVQIGRASC